MNKKIAALIFWMLPVVAFSATLVPVQLLGPSGSTSGQAIISTGSSSAPAWGAVAATSLAAEAANTVVANFTGSSASPVAFSMPSCSTSSSILQYSSGSGITCNTGIWASPPSIGGTAPNSGKFTTLNATGASTLTGGIIGDVTGTPASAGNIGEVVSQTFSAVNITTSGVVQNLTSINLSAGEYIVWGSATYTSGTGATMTIWITGASQTSATLPALGVYFQSGGSITATGAATAIAPMQSMALSTSKTIYLPGEAVFSGGAVTASGFIAALRIH